MSDTDRAGSTTPDVTVVFPAANRRGGVERVAYDFLEHLVRSRGKATFVGYELAPRHATSPTFVQLPPRGRLGALSPLLFRRRVRRALRRRPESTVVTFGATCPPGDVLWVQSVHKAWLARSRQVTWRGRRVPASVRYLLLRHQVLLRMEAQYFRSRRPRLILCTSQQEVDDLAKFYGVDRALMHVVPNGYDPTQFSPARTGELRGKVRTKMGAAPDDIILLFVANELQRKGFAETLAAMAATRDPRFRLALVGRKPPHDYAEIIRRLGLSDRVTYQGATDDVGWWLAGADFLVLPTQYEPFGIVIVEALATGVPVITTRLAGASAAVEHGKNGLLQEDPHDVTELTRLLMEAAAADREAWSKAALRAAAAYQWPKIFREVDAMLAHVDS